MTPSERKLLDELVADRRKAAAKRWAVSAAIGAVATAALAFLALRYFPGIFR